MFPEMKIKKLGELLINKIAAGEVIERPASVVKELVENSIDAGATKIQVVIEEGGRSLIRVVDNGCGLGRDDALLAFTRHTTSKISSEEDLGRIHTNGFRGEALAAISSVARVTLQTKPIYASGLGVQIYLEGGVVKEVKSLAFQSGTVIEINGLFFNTPVRKKFLKSNQTENSRIRSQLRRLALANPKVQIELTQEGKSTFFYPSTDNLFERARLIFKGSLIKITAHNHGVKVNGLVGHPSTAQSDSDSFVILVNGRPVVDRTVIRAVRDGFSGTLKTTKNPLGFIAIELPFEQVDVNVHPQKSEVRFEHPEIIFTVVRGAVSRCLSDFKEPLFFNSESTPFKPITPITPYGTNSQKLFSEPLKPSLLNREVSSRFSFISPASEVVNSFNPIHQSSRNIETEKPELDSLCYNKASNLEEFENLSYVGLFLDCYLLFSNATNLLLVDMHAAHERINYNRIFQALKNSLYTTQKFLLPKEFHFSPDLYSKVKENLNLLENVGFMVELQKDKSLLSFLGEPTFIGLNRHLPEASFREIVNNFIHEDFAITDFNSFINKVASSIACHSSIRSGDYIAPYEAEELLNELLNSDLANSCPHGRPIYISFTKNNIEKLFSRRNY
jgi:DNA mismatch repair protein MutL